MFGVPAFHAVSCFALGAYQYEQYCYSVTRQYPEAMWPGRSPDPGAGIGILVNEFKT